MNVLAVKVAEINRAGLPPGVTIVPHYDRTALIDRTLHTVRRNMAEGIGFVLVVLVAFLGIANARSLARLFSPLAGAGEAAGRRFLSAERVAGLLEPRPGVELEDLTYGRPMPVGAGGLWLAAPGLLDGPVLCHPGVGGAIAWAEPGTGLSVAICHDRMFGPVPEHPFAQLTATIRALARREKGAR